MNEYAKMILTFFLSSTFIGFIQFLINRKDTKEEKQDNLYKDLEDKIEGGLKERSEEGRERFEIHEKKYHEIMDSVNEIKSILIKLTNSQEEQSSIIKANSEVTIGLAQDRIDFLAKKYQARGGITNEEYAMLESIYKPYHDSVLKGNGRGKAGFEYCRDKLPRITTEEAKRLDDKLERQFGPKTKA